MHKQAPAARAIAPNLVGSERRTRFPLSSSRPRKCQHPSIRRDFTNCDTAAEFGLERGLRSRFVTLALRARLEVLCLPIADNLLRFRIPGECSTESHGNVREVTRGDRAMMGEDV